MAYRLEKEPNGGTAIVIDGWENGIAPDPYSGLNSVVQANLAVPGEVSVGYPITASTTSGATLGDPIARSTRYFTYGSGGAPAGSIQSWAILDATGQVWEASTFTGTWTYLSNGASETGATENDGLAFWGGYLFKTRGANLDYWNGTTWSNAWQTTLTSGTKHFMYVGTDNVLYITNNNWVASLSLTDPGSPNSFNPASSSTYTFEINKISISPNDVAISLTEIGGGNTPNSTLLIGGIQSVIYPWDKTSPNFALPINVGDSYMKNMVSVNQNAFIFPGAQSGRGRIYITNGSQADLFFKMPDYLFGVNTPYFEWGDAIFHRNHLIFSAFVVSNAGSVLDFRQVYAVNLETKVFQVLSTIPTSGTVQGSGRALLSAGPTAGGGFKYIIGWDNNSSAPGIGRSSTTVGTSGQATIYTDLIPIGTFLQKQTFSQVEFKLRTALAANENIFITPVVDGVEGTSLFTAFNPAITTGSISGVAPVNFQGAQWLQFKIVLEGTSATSGVRLKELRLR